MMPNKAITWILCICIGLLFGWLVSLGIRESLKAHEVRNWEAGRPIFDRPVTETYAKEIKHEIEDEMDRQGVMARASAHDSAIHIFILKLLAFLCDPINLGLVIVFTLISHRILRKVDWHQICQDPPSSKVD